MKRKMQENERTLVRSQSRDFPPFLLCTATIAVNDDDDTQKKIMTEMKSVVAAENLCPRYFCVQFHFMSLIFISNQDHLR